MQHKTNGNINLKKNTMLDLEIYKSVKRYKIADEIKEKVEQLVIITRFRDKYSRKEVEEHVETIEILLEDLKRFID